MVARIMISKQPVVLIARLIPWANQCELHKAMAGHKFGLAPHSSLVEYLEEEARNLHDTVGTQCTKATDFIIILLQDSDLNSSVKHLNMTPHHCG
jgi:hypothetical protein